MNSIETVLERMRGQRAAPALYWRGATTDYDAFFRQVESWEVPLAKNGIDQGSIVGIFGDYSPGTCSLIFALMQARAIIVPFTKAIEQEIAPLLKIAGVEYMFRFDSDDQWILEAMPDAVKPDLVSSFIERKMPGLIVFTSGSTGKPKGILHDCERVMRKFVTKRDGWRTVLFLMMDHFGGFNTLLGTFAYGGIGVCLEERLPDAVCRAVEHSGADLLPTTPTFLNLLLALGSWSKFDLSSVRLITYGTEVMPEATLAKIRKAFPKARIKQTYGLSELGVLRSKSREDGSTWVSIGGDGFETKVIDGVLWIRSEANMVGYLNAPDPIDADGWMCTNDLVEVEGDYMRFLGRTTELINVGGQKVYPVEVETVLLQADNIGDAVVQGVDHPLMGQMVSATISLKEEEDADEAARRLRRFCLERLAKYKVPARIKVVDAGQQRNDRFKKLRKAPA